MTLTINAAGTGRRLALRLLVGAAAWWPAARAWAATSPPVTSAVTVSPAGPGTARPPYNTGVGFYTLSGAAGVTALSNPKIYDANGNTFRPRGVNRLHWGDNVDAGIANSNANCERYVFGWVADLFSTRIPTIIRDGVFPGGSPS
jgi:hypothetical protein